MIFKIFIDFQEDMYQIDWASLDPDKRGEWFVSAYLLDYSVHTEGELEGEIYYEWKSIVKINIILIYFAFTSVTTVGFGDYCPKSDFERIILSIFLLLGVNIFSMVAGEFLLMLTSYRKLHEVYEDSEKLNHFLGVLRKFNWDMPLEGDV